MTRKFCWVFFALVTGLLLVVVGWLCVGGSKESTVTQENFEKIQVGMNGQRVQAILGGPEGTYATTGRERKSLEQDFAVCNSDWTVESWEGNDCIIYVSFDSAGTVMSTNLARLDRTSGL